MTTNESYYRPHLQQQRSILERFLANLQLIFKTTYLPWTYKEALHAAPKELKSEGLDDIFTLTRKILIL
jgi:hypothetical protein